MTAICVLLYVLPKWFTLVLRLGASAITDRFKDETQELKSGRLITNAPYFGSSLTAFILLMITAALLSLFGWALCLILWPFLLACFLLMDLALPEHGLPAAWSAIIVVVAAVASVLLGLMFCGIMVGVSPWWNIWSRPKQIESIAKDSFPFREIWQRKPAAILFLSFYLLLCFVLPFVVPPAREIMSQP